MLSKINYVCRTPASQSHLLLWFAFCVFTVSGKYQHLFFSFPFLFLVPEIFTALKEQCAVAMKVISCGQSEGSVTSQFSQVHSHHLTENAAPPMLLWSKAQKNWTVDAERHLHLKHAPLCLSFFMYSSWVHSSAHNAQCVLTCIDLLTAGLCCTETWALRNLFIELHYNTWTAMTYSWQENMIP